jgi:hypothetical protein
VYGAPGQSAPVTFAQKTGQDEQWPLARDRAMTIHHRGEEAMWFIAKRARLIEVLP